MPIPIGSHIVYNSNPDNNTKRPEWCKGLVKDLNSPGQKYTIQNDSGRYLTRTRRDIRPNNTGTCVTKSGRISRPPDRLEVKM